MSEEKMIAEGSHVAKKAVKKAIREGASSAKEVRKALGLKKDDADFNKAFKKYVKKQLEKLGVSAQTTTPSDAGSEETKPAKKGRKKDKNKKGKDKKDKDKKDKDKKDKDKKDKDKKNGGLKKTDQDKDGEKQKEKTGKTKKEEEASAPDFEDRVKDEIEVEAEENTADSKNDLHKKLTEKKKSGTGPAKRGKKA